MKYVDPRELRPRQTFGSMLGGSYKEVLRSMQKFGFLPEYPIEVVSYNDVLYINEGHTRTAVALSLGIKHVPVILVDPPMGMTIDQFVSSATETARYDFEEIWRNQN